MCWVEKLKKIFTRMILLNSKKKILVISGSRSDYSLLKPLILKLKKEKKFLTQLVITGSHLEKKFGNTYKEIVGDKIKINKKIYLNLKNADKKDIASSTSIGIKKFFKLFYAKKPEGVILLGDRYEIFSAAYAAYLQGIKIFHFARVETDKPELCMTTHLGRVAVLLGIGVLAVGRAALRAETVRL